MAEEAAGDEKDDASRSAERRVHEPELCRGHFFENAADPADEIVRGEEVQIINADDGGGQRGRRDACVERERDREDVREPDAVQDVKGNEPADRNFAFRNAAAIAAPTASEMNPVTAQRLPSAHLGDFRRLRKLLRPEPPEHDCAREDS